MGGPEASLLGDDEEGGHRSAANDPLESERAILGGVSARE